VGLLAPGTWCSYGNTKKVVGPLPLGPRPSYGHVLVVITFISVYITRYNKSTAQVMIRWCLQHGYLCVPKTLRPEKVKEYCDVFDFHITDEDSAMMVSFGMK
jgi:diketogulonate reductase-like aldo/keto reductase